MYINIKNKSEKINWKFLFKIRNSFIVIRIVISYFNLSHMDSLHVLTQSWKTVHLYCYKNWDELDLNSSQLNLLFHSNRTKHSIQVEKIRFTKGHLLYSCCTRKNFFEFIISYFNMIIILRCLLSDYWNSEKKIFDSYNFP